MIEQLDLIWSTNVGKFLICGFLAAFFFAAHTFTMLRLRELKEPPEPPEPNEQDRGKPHSRLRIVSNREAA